MDDSTPESRNPEFSHFIPKNLFLRLLDAQALIKAQPSGSRIQTILQSWPVSRRAQAIFAEAFRQGLASGLAVDEAVRIASGVTPSHRFRQALWQMVAYLRSGYSLEASLAKTHVGVQPALLVALRTGEEHNCLDVALSAFARRTGRLTAKTFSRKIGRSLEVIQFAAALAVLLRDHPMTVREVRAAGKVAAGGMGKFGRIFEEVACRMEDGESLIDALGHYPRQFDRLYREILESTRSREELRKRLEQLGRSEF